MIDAKGLTFSYDGRKRILDNVSLRVRRGELVAILGHNGCGKSTLARHFNALLEVQAGELTVAGLDARREENVWQLRRRVGMVFQNPDNQFVSTLVGEDVAFGLENYGVPEAEIPGRVAAALAAVGMAGFEERAPHTLSGGQKQRVALAGVLAGDPEILIFDEATAMLDPDGRREVLEMIRALHERGKTVVMISHYIEEAVMADRVILLHDGRVLADGTPRETLTDPALLARTGLTPSLPVRLYYDLQAAGVTLPRCPLTTVEIAEALCQLR